MTANVKKAVDLISNQAYQSAYYYLQKDVVKARDKYERIKDTMRPEKQKKLVDKYIMLLLLKAYSAEKIGEENGCVNDLKRIKIFFDSTSENLYLFKAYAMAFLADIYQKKGNLIMAESLHKESKKHIGNYTSLGVNDDKSYKKILVGIFGFID